MAMSKHTKSPEEQRGERIRAEREKKNWSQERLARLIDVSSSHLSKIELGKAGQKLEAKTLSGLAAVLGRSMAWIETGVESSDRAEEDLDTKLMKVRIALIEAYGTSRYADLVRQIDALSRAEPERSNSSLPVGQRAYSARSGRRGPQARPKAGS